MAALTKQPYLFIELVDKIVLCCYIGTCSSNSPEEGVMSGLADKMLHAPNNEELQQLIWLILTTSDDADEVSFALLFCLGTYKTQLAEKLITITSSPFHLIDVMGRVPELAEHAWKKFLLLGPSDIVLEYAWTIPAVREVVSVEMRLRHPLPPQPSMQSSGPPVESR